MGDEVREDETNALFGWRVVYLEILLLDAHDDLNESVSIALVEKAPTGLPGVLVRSQVDH
jgi:hypothetical protein